MDLSSLSNEPRHHADCCLSLSTHLIDRLISLFDEAVRFGIVLSVGSGSGLLENLLLQKWEQGGGSAAIEGVEVRSGSSGSMNRYLPEEAINTVGDTRQVSSRIERACVLMFVYPRSPQLIQDYLTAIMERACPTRWVIWLGPKADWDEFAPCFRGSAKIALVEVVQDPGLVQYELMAIVGIAVGSTVDDCRQELV